jgi:hypothetical protein
MFLYVLICSYSQAKSAGHVPSKQFWECLPFWLETQVFKRDPKPLCALRPMLIGSSVHLGTWKQWGTKRSWKLTSMRSLLVVPQWFLTHVQMYKCTNKRKHTGSSANDISGWLPPLVSAKSCPRVTDMSGSFQKVASAALWITNRPTKTMGSYGSKFKPPKVVACWSILQIINPSRFDLLCVLISLYIWDNQNILLTNIGRNAIHLHLFVYWGYHISHYLYIFHVQVWPISTWLHSLPQSRSCAFAGTPGRRGKEATVLRTERCNKLDTDLFQWFWMIWGTPMYLTSI